MDDERRPPLFEQYVKMMGCWHKLSTAQRVWVKSVSAGARRVRFVGSGGTRYGWTNVHKLWRQYLEKVKKHEKGMAKTRQVQQAWKSNRASSEPSC